MSETLRQVYLSNIEAHSEWCVYSARNITRYVQELSHRPPYETIAGDAIKRAELALAEALMNVRQAREDYERLKLQERP